MVVVMMTQAESGVEVGEMEEEEEEELMSSSSSTGLIDHHHHHLPPRPIKKRAHPSSSSSSSRSRGVAALSLPVVSLILSSSDVHDAAASDAYGIKTTTDVDPQRAEGVDGRGGSEKKKTDRKRRRGVATTTTPTAATTTATPNQDAEGGVIRRKETIEPSCSYSSGFASAALALKAVVLASSSPTTILFAFPLISEYIQRLLLQYAQGGKKVIAKY